MTIPPARFALSVLFAATLVACQPAADDADDAARDAAAAADRSDDSAAAPEPAPPGDGSDTRPYDGIAADETLHFTGTEPFWGGEVANGMLTYTTPDDQSGRRIPVERFAGRGGVSFIGAIEGLDFTMAVTPGACSDGMSDRTYPFTVTLELADETRRGCGWTDRQGFTGAANP